LFPHTTTLFGDGVNFIDDDTANARGPDLGESRVEKHLGEDLRNGDKNLTVLRVVDSAEAKRE
jgi:FlaG/FlaF family flagellin (archaellin)